MLNQQIRPRLALVLAAAIMAAWSSSVPAVASTHSGAPISHSSHVAMPANAILRREVFGFVNAANLGDPNVGYQSWNLSLLSTVAYFAIHVNTGDGGLIGNDTGWYVFHSSTMSNFVSAAHANGVRVIVSINVHDFSTDPNNGTCTALVPTVSQVTVAETVSEVQKAGIDGVNINYEGTITTCANGSSNRAELVTFVKNMRTALPAGSYLSIDTFSGSAEDNQEFFDVTGLAPYVDSMFVMAYDMDYANSTEAPIYCSQFCFNPVSPLKTYRFNVTKSMQQYTALVSPSKVILGQPYFGRRGCVARSDVALQYPTRDLVTTTYLYASTIPAQSGVHNFAAHRDGGDGVSEWDTWYDTDWACIREQYFDDVISLGAKYDVVNNYNLRGVGLFTLDYGGGATELWNELNLKFATPTPWTLVGGNITSTPDPVSWGTNRTDVFVRGTEGGVWDATWNGSSWTWTFLGGVINGSPAAVSWAPGRIDLFVRGVDNALWHRAYNGTTWEPWEKLGGVITGGPDVASWGPNRLDVFVAGSEPALWQVTWDGTAWTWKKLGGVITSDPTAVSSTSNRIDVFVRGTEGGLWQASFDGAAWTWNFLGGILTSNPEPASCSAGHLDVFLSGTEHGLWRRGFNGTIWTPWQFQRGQWTASPGATCIPGTSNVAVFERSADGQVWQTSMPAS
jgi:spore germination protein YaaH